MEINLLFWLILGFSAYRITRFLVIDTFFEGFRARFHTFLFNRQGKLQFFAHKLLDLVSCTFCLGFWVSLAVYALFFWTNPLEFNQVDWLTVFAISGVQSLLHAFEPSEE